MADETYSIQEALKVQEAMRTELGLKPERFETPAFVGMLSDEIEKLRDAGRSDGEIAELVRQEIGRDLSPADIAKYYASPEDRRHG
jgi:hypothetical protein